MPEFLSIKDAALRYDKAEITVRRLVRSIANDPKHEDRRHLKPTPEEVAKLKKGRKPFTYSVETSLLDRMYLAKEIAKKASAKNLAKAAGSDEVVGLLKKTNSSLEDQLKVKDDQIKALNQALDDLSERQRETNILMKGLQEKFVAIPAPKKKAVVAPAANTESSKKEGKPGWWLW